MPSTAVAESLIGVLELEGDDAAAVWSVALPDVGRAYRKVSQPRAVAVAERADSGVVRIFPEPEPLPPGVQSRIVRPSPYA